MTAKPIATRRSEISGAGDAHRSEARAMSIAGWAMLIVAAVLSIVGQVTGRADGTTLIILGLFVLLGWALWNGADTARARAEIAKLRADLT